MAQQPQRENADAFSILMRPQPFLASIISETSIVSNDGSLEDSMVTDACPDFSSVYIVKANTSSCPSQTNSVETHFVISKRIKSANRSYSCSATCSFCGTLFANTNQSKMRIHLTGEREGQTRVAECTKAPPLCKQYYIDKKASDRTEKASKFTKHSQLLKAVIDEHAPQLPISGQKRVRQLTPEQCDTPHRRAAELDQEGRRYAFSLSPSSLPPPSLPHSLPHTSLPRAPGWRMPACTLCTQECAGDAAHFFAYGIFWDAICSVLQICLKMCSSRANCSEDGLR